MLIKHSKLYSLSFVVLTDPWRPTGQSAPSGLSPCTDRRLIASLRQNPLQPIFTGWVSSCLQSLLLLYQTTCTCYVVLIFISVRWFCSHHTLVNISTNLQPPVRLVMLSACWQKKTTASRVIDSAVHRLSGININDVAIVDKDVFMERLLHLNETQVLNISDCVCLWLRDFLFTKSWLIRAKAEGFDLFVGNEMHKVRLPSFVLKVCALICMIVCKWIVV